MTQPRGCEAAVCSAVCADPATDPVGPVVRLLRTTGVLVAIVVGVVMVAILTAVPGNHRDRRGAWGLHHLSRWILRAVGVRLVVDGAPRSGPSLVVGNHISWIDILALSASSPMQMVAKAEVGDWPVIGAVARRTGTLFLQRNCLRDLPRTVDGIADALRSGGRVQVFPGGTTRCGGALDPFRRAAFQAAINAGVVISPVTVEYADDQRRRTTTVAFVGGETLAASFRRVVAMRGGTVRVVWLKPIPAIAGTGRDAIDRARVARLAENAVARSLRSPVVGRDLGVSAGPRSAAASMTQSKLETHAA